MPLYKSLVGFVKGSDYYAKDGLSSQVQSVWATNLISNGDFSDGATGWSVKEGTTSTANNTLSVTADGLAYYNRTLNTLGYGVTGKQYYFRLNAKVTNSACVLLRVDIRNNGDSSFSNYIAIATPTININNTMSGILVIPAALDDSQIYFHIEQDYADAATANGKVMEVQYVSCIDLTATFGAGNEPTKEQMDAFMAQLPNNWFDTTTQISPSATYPSAITSNLAAGTYKYTSNDGIYEFTLDDELRGIGTAVDKVVFDRVSHNGILETKNARIASYNGESITASHLSTTGALTTGAEVVYQLATPTTAALAFAKVASSAATEVPMVFLTSTPSDDYPVGKWIGGSSGSAILTAGTTTTITDATAKTTSTILLSPTSLAVIALTPYVSTKSNGSFVITTLTAAGTESLDWVLVN